MLALSEAFRTYYAFSKKIEEWQDKYKTMEGCSRYSKGHQKGALEEAIVALEEARVALETPKLL